MPFKERRTVWSTVVTSAVEKSSFSSCLAASVAQVHVQDSSVVLLMTSLVKCCIWQLEIFPSSDSLLRFFSTVKIPIPEEEHPHLLIKALPDGYKVRDKGFPGGSKVSMITAITGTNSFSTGEHYWEVSLGSTNTDPKRSWWLGVTSVFNIPVNADFCPTESEGYWFLSSSSENPDFLQLSTEPTLLPVNSKPERVGVYLNCEKGTVIFYDVDNSSIIGRLTGDFQGEVFPFFNPGLFDAAPLSILHHNNPILLSWGDCKAQHPLKQQVHHVNSDKM